MDLYGLHMGRDIIRPKEKEVIKYCDILVDGEYVQELRDITLAFRGSKNQRLIDVQQTMQKGEIILWNNKQ